MIHCRARAWLLPVLVLSAGVVPETEEHPADWKSVIAQNNDINQ